MKLVLVIIALMGLASCTRSAPSESLEGRPCKPDVLAKDSSTISSECGAIGTGATCFVPKGATIGGCRQYKVSSMPDPTWKQAFERCDALKEGGFKWRLPTVLELESLCESEVYSDPPTRTFGSKIPGRSNVVRGCPHADGILGAPFREVSSSERNAWSSTCATSESFLRRIWYTITTGKNWPITITGDADCTLPSSGFAIYVDFLHGSVQTGFLDAKHSDFGLCVRNL